MKYRMLKKGEFIEDGDEFLASIGWKKARSVGTQIHKYSFKYRRPIKSNSNPKRHNLEEALRHIISGVTKEEQLRRFGAFVQNGYRRKVK